MTTNTRLSISFFNLRFSESEISMRGPSEYFATSAWHHSSAPDVLSGMSVSSHINSTIVLLVLLQLIWGHDPLNLRRIELLLLVRTRGAKVFHNDVDLLATACAARHFRRESQDWNDTEIFASMKSAEVYLCIHSDNHYQSHAMPARLRETDDWRKLTRSAEN